MIRKLARTQHRQLAIIINLRSIATWSVGLPIVKPRRSVAKVPERAEVDTTNLAQGRLTGVASGLNMQRKEREKAGTFIGVRKVKNNMRCLQVRGTGRTTPSQMIYCFVPVKFVTRFRPLKLHYFSSLRARRFPPGSRQTRELVMGVTGMERSVLQARVSPSFLTSSSFFAFSDAFAYASWPTYLA